MLNKRGLSWAKLKILTAMKPSGPKVSISNIFIWVTGHRDQEGKKVDEMLLFL